MASNNNKPRWIGGGVYGRPHEDWRLEMNTIRNRIAEAEYNKRKKENIKPLELYDYQDYSDWKKLPKLITV